VDWSLTEAAARGLGPPTPVFADERPRQAPRAGEDLPQLALGLLRHAAAEIEAAFAWHEL
jgi:hypothetical protein